MAFLVGALTVFPLISALAFNAPEATPMADYLGLHAQVRSPQPTEAPTFDLIERQSSVQLSLIEGPDAICGYQYGLSSKRSILVF